MNVLKIAAILLALVLPAHAQMAAGLQVLDAQISATQAGGNVALRMVLENQTPHNQVLVAVSTPVAARVMFQTYGRDDHGLAEQQPLNSITLPANSQTVVAPGALEIRLMNLQNPLEHGYEIPLTLHFKNGAMRTLRVKITE